MGTLFLADGATPQERAVIRPMGRGRKWLRPMCSRERVLVGLPALALRFAGLCAAIPGLSAAIPGPWARAAFPTAAGRSHRLGPAFSRSRGGSIVVGAFSPVSI